MVRIFKYVNDVFNILEKCGWKPQIKPDFEARKWVAMNRTTASVIECLKEDIISQKLKSRDTDSDNSEGKSDDTALQRMSGRTREESIRSETLGRFSPKAKVRKIKIDFEALARLGNPNPEERKREKRRRARQNKRERKLAELKEAMKASGVESKDKDSEISKLISKEEDSSQVRKRRKLQEVRESEVIRRGLFRSSLAKTLDHASAGKEK